jgi:hypothetical protein
MFTSHLLSPIRPCDQLSEGSGVRRRPIVQQTQAVLALPVRQQASVRENIGPKGVLLLVDDGLGEGKERRDGIDRRVGNWWWNRVWGEDREGVGPVEICQSASECTVLPSTQRERERKSEKERSRRETPSDQGEWTNESLLEA